MNLAEAMQAVQDGKRVRSDAIPQGWVVKLQLVQSPGGPKFDYSVIRVVCEATGSSFDFTPTPERVNAEWHLVEGWATYGQG